MASSAGVHDGLVRAGYWVCWSDEQRVADIPLQLFTHVYLGFAKVDFEGHVFIPDTNLEPFVHHFVTTVRERNASAKILLSIGGEGVDLSSVVADEDKRANFISASRDLAQKFRFDGLDLCWLYPSEANLKIGLRDLLYEWRSALPKPFLLTAEVFHHPVHNTFIYPIKAIKDNLDWINVLAIDFYTPSLSNSPNETGPSHAWLARSQDLPAGRGGSLGIKDWIDKGVASNKLVFSLPFYGYEWQLVSNTTHDDGFFEPASGGNAVHLAYKAIQERLQSGIYKTVYSRTYEAVYSREISGKHWIGYDDGCSISGKVNKALIEEYNLGGYFAWKHLGDDDLYGTLSRSAYESSIVLPPDQARS